MKIRYKTDPQSVEIRRQSLDGNVHFFNYKPVGFNGNGITQSRANSTPYQPIEKFAPGHFLRFQGALQLSLRPGRSHSYLIQCDALGLGKRKVYGIGNHFRFENFTFILDTGQWWGSPGTNRAGASDPNVDIYGYMEQTAPYASYVRAKIYKIDSGREEWIDYRRIMTILKAVNFNGCMSIVFEDRGNRCGYAEAIGLAVSHLRDLLADDSSKKLVEGMKQEQ